MSIFHIKSILLIVTVLAFTGCAQKAQMKNMTVKHLDETIYDAKYESNIAIKTITGGTETNPAMASEINDEEFKKAVIASLINAHLYSKDGDYKLKIEILEVDQPSFGFDMTVTLTVKYTLINDKEKTMVFQKTIKKPYTATTGDAFSGVKRLQMAKEGSAKENIYALLKELKN